MPPFSIHVPFESLLLETLLNPVYHIFIMQRNLHLLAVLQTTARDTAFHLLTQRDVHLQPKQLCYSYFFCC